MKILWATTFSADLWAVSGSRMVESFVSTGTPHTLVAYAEGVDVPALPRVTARRLDGDPFLKEFLAANRDIIPASLGGDVREPECRCPGGPYDVHYKKHVLPCVGYWFCKNAYRWLRKVVSVKRAADEFGAAYDILMWVDSDVLFKRGVPPARVAGWFPPRVGCIYLKNRRPAVETGVVGYHMSAGGRKVIDAMYRRYASGLFRRDERWDDCVQLWAGMRAAKGVLCADLARRVGERATVIQHSPIGEYLTHDKGSHLRAGVLK